MSAWKRRARDEYRGLIEKAAQNMEETGTADALAGKLVELVDAAMAVSVRAQDDLIGKRLRAAAQVFPDPRRV